MVAGYFDYKDGGDVCEAYVSQPEATPGAAARKRPAVLVAHQWAGQSDHERAIADRLALMGYVGIALDVYGKGVRGGPDADNEALMTPWASDRAKLKKRLLSAVEFAKSRPEVDVTRVAMIGYCFGGLCALDVARSGTGDVQAAVSFHGLLIPPGIGEQGKVSTKVLVHHGWNDPMAPPEHVTAFGKEMTDAGADWQLVAHGGTYHAFTAVGANAPENGMQYNANADRRSWASTAAFLADTFGGVSD